MGIEEGLTALKLCKLLPIALVFDLAYNIRIIYECESVRDTKATLTLINGLRGHQFGKGERC